ncbi:Uncharacterized membrane protein YesL [Alkalibacterium putridalgicola]|uniref:Uncharacterized membrane protein YesL n=1 Tax=Alkalibacterium putridalgicola TaxID=426703 RepID=A0A1H7QK36_9LACT|nr:DUF624 domain-containing protein [Alkalibacterium putridalgicola]GEK88435.1 hypothetical protein APU01nite_04740 [Alkalibacterium putridalgicola]SEL48296.1 Uncharacterized membrane protein YesL [Alkalibacterium putridalgicola]
MENAEGGSMDLIMKGFDWLATLAFLNILWLGFTLAGGILFGAGPATFAVNALVKKKLHQDDLSHVFTKFKTEFKEHFKEGNRYFWLVTAASLFIYVDIRVIQALPQNTFIQLVVLPSLLILSALVIIVATFALGIYFEFGDSVIKSLKDAFWLTLISPVAGIMIVHAFLIGLLVYAYVPALIMFYSVSSYAFVTQWIMSKTFKRIKRKKYSNSY